MTAFDRLSKRFEAFDQTQRADEIEMRMQFATIVLKTIRRKGWNQRRLAHEIGVSDAQVSQLVHGDENRTIQTIVRVFRALGLKGSLGEFSAEPQVEIGSSTEAKAFVLKRDSTDGKAIEWASESKATETGDIRFVG